MEKIVMYLKKVIILLCGIVLGYLTSRRTDMSISLECILGDGVFIVLVITIIMVITKEKIKLGINCAIFGLSFVIGSTSVQIPYPIPLPPYPAYCRSPQNIHAHPQISQYE